MKQMGLSSATSNRLWNALLENRLSVTLHLEATGLNVNLDVANLPL